MTENKLITYSVATIPGEYDLPNVLIGKRCRFRSAKYEIETYITAVEVRWDEDSNHPTLILILDSYWTCTVRSRGADSNILCTLRVRGAHYAPNRGTLTLI